MNERNSGTTSTTLAQVILVTAENQDERNTDDQIGTERRRWDRLNVSIPMFLRGEDGNGNFLHFVTAVNVGAGGLLVASRSYVAPGSEVTIEFPEVPLLPGSPLKDAPRKLQARVIRASSDTAFLLGVEFAEPLSSG